MKILLLNGVNMNMLGKRDNTLYGSDTLATLEQKVQDFAKSLGAELICAQSNIEGELVNILQQTDCDAVVFNAGAYAHYSYALRDCIECINIPVVNVHMSNIYARESFRHTDVLASVCSANFVGQGIQSYFDAVEFLVKNDSVLNLLFNNF